MTDHGTYYAERDAEAYSRLQRRLISDQGSQIQVKFLEATRSGSSFLEFMNIHDVIATNGRTVELFDGPLTEQSFKEPTEDQERTAFEKWADVSPRTACRTSFWADVTLRHIEAGAIEEAHWLAANGGKNESGEVRIDRAFREKEEKRPKAIDDCVRTVLRRMSGLPAARGNRSVFVNPSFGRAWWRERMVARISGRQGVEVEDRTALLNVVRCGQYYWEGLVTMIVSRGSVFGSEDVQDAFVNSMAKHFKAAPNTPLKKIARLRDALRRFSNIAASRELGVLEFSEIGEIADALLAALHQQMAGGESSQGESPVPSTR